MTHPNNKTCQNCNSSFVPNNNENWCQECIVEIKKKYNEKYGKEIPKIKLNQLKGGNMNMSKISDFVKDYQPVTTTKNIADLKEVSVDLELEDDEFEYVDKMTKQPKVVKQKIIMVNGEAYRVPISVIQQLKVLLEDSPTMKKFKVKKTGTTKDDVRYQVIPIF